MKVVIFLSFFLTLLGCQTVDKIYTVIADPDVQVGEKEEQPSVVNLIFVSDDQVNLNYEHEPTTVKVDVYQLKDNYRFLSADYDSLLNDDEETLGKSFISMQEYFMEPSDSKYVSQVELDENTKYLGIVAHYADLENVIWKRVLKVNAKGDNSNILFFLKEYELRLNKMEE